MRATTVFGYLMGRDASIRAVARHPRALPVGAVFVLAAALAREYDKEDLLHAPWHLALPFVASLLTSLVLHQMLYLTFRPVHQVPWKASYRSFLGLYWWTAPLALLYGIPFERWCTPAQATALNLLLLALVATWRVGLITRATAVAWHVRPGAVLPVVLCFGAIVVVTLLGVVPLPLVSIMGGVQLSESETLISNVTQGARFWALLLLPALTAMAVRAARIERLARIKATRRPQGSGGIEMILLMILVVLGFFLSGFSLLSGSDGNAVQAPTLFFLIPAIAVGAILGLHPPSAARSARTSTSPAEVGEPDGPVRPSLIACLVLFLLPWLVPLPWTQPEQQRRFAVEKAVREGDFDTMARHLRETERAAFPPHWDPPPRVGYGEREPRPARVLLSAVQRQAPAWFVSMYVDRFASAELRYGVDTFEFRNDEEAALFGQLRPALEAYTYLDELRRLAPHDMRELESLTRRRDVVLPDEPAPATAPPEGG